MNTAEQACWRSFVWNDMLVLVVIGALAADAVAGGSTSAGDLLLMIVVVLLWSYVLDILEYRVPAFRRLMRPPQTRLVENGRMLRRNMRCELVTEEEIRATLRKEASTICRMSSQPTWKPMEKSAS